MLPKKEKREQVPFETGEEKQKINVRHQENLFEKIDSEQDEKVDRVDAEVVMERSRADILIEKSKVNYNAVIKTVCNMYDGIFSKDAKFTYSRQDLLADYDSYLQAILVKICYVNDRFTQDNMRFIENVADYGKLVEGADFTLFANCAKDMRDVVLEKAEERLKQVPVCFKLAGAVDKSKNLGITKSMLDYTAKIAFNLKFIDEKADKNDNSDIISSLKSIFVFAKANGINVK